MRDRDRITYHSLAAGLTLSLVLGTVGAPILASDGDDLIERTDTTYRLLPAEGVVRAESKLKLTNKSKPITKKERCKNGRAICTTKTRYYFTGWNSFWAPVRAGNVSLTGPKLTTLPAQPHGDGFAYGISFPKLWNKKGAKQTATFRFDLGAGTVDDVDAPTRIEDGYAHFCWWGMVGDTGVTKAILPPGWEPVGRNDGIVVERNADGVVLRAKSKQDPASFVDCIEVVDPERLDRTYVTGEAGKSLVVIEAWPGDTDWATSTTEVAAEALPNLEAMLGSPLPGDELRVREVATQSRRYVYGDLRPTDGVLGMGEDADARSYLASALARQWLDPGHITSPWLAEGLSVWLATRALADASCMDPMPHPGPDAPDLDTWVEVTSPEIMALGNWQQATACNLIATGAEVIGEEAMVDLARDLIGAPVPVGTSHWLAGVAQELPEGLDELVAAMDAAGVDH